jgi:hypothetical protein
MEMGRDNGTMNNASGCDGSSSNQRHDDGDAATLATGVAGVRSP